MRNGNTILLILLAMMLAIPVHAGTIRDAANRAMNTYAYDAGEHAGFAELSEQPDANAPYGSSIYDFETRSPKRAFLYSLLIPGAGQLYAGSKVKAAAFFAADVAAWGAFLSFHSKGKTKEDEYQVFADAHWNPAKYWDGLLTFREIPEWGDEAAFAHHLPYTIVNGQKVVNRSGEYYENIGKYDQFVWGWDDLDTVAAGQDPPEDNVRSRANRDTYVRMREDANTQFDRATTAVIVSIANHLISAFDAARTARSFNRSTERAQRLDVDLRFVNLEDVPTPWLNVAYRF